MKESVTKFDFESAFKALDEIDTPAAKKGIKANRPALTEIFSRKSKFESLFEEYYDVGNAQEMGEAKEAQEAEIAKAKLARIEKIVDLDANSPEDLLTSYVGKYIVQCPQCMVLFYKDKEDVVASEEDPSVVNVGEVCQHCGNESGYTLVGKVGEAEEEADIPEDELANDELQVEEEQVEEGAEEAAEESNEDASEESLDGLEGLDDLNLDLEEPEEEKKEESFAAHTGELLTEEVEDDADLDAKLAAHNEYIEYLRTTIAQEEALEKADNEQVKAAIQRRIDAFKADLEAALPEEVKNELAAEMQEAPAEEVTEDQSEVEESSNEETTEEQVEESLEIDSTSLTESLKEETDLGVSADEFKELIDSPEFKKPISDVAVRAMLNSEKYSEKEDKEIKESRAIYHCDDCGHEIELDDKEYDGKCPNCHEHHGFYKLEEGVFDNVKNALGKAKDNISNFIDSKIKSRASAAEFILENALKDYTKAAEDSANRKFKAFTVVYFTDKFNDGTEITTTPKTTDFNKLVRAKDAEAKVNYTDAENIAKGWSKIADNGPALIFLANSATDEAAEFLCMYFKGELDKNTDQLAKQFEKVKNSLAGGKSMAKGKAGQTDTKQVKASELDKGAKIVTKNKGVAEIVEKTEGDVADFKITYKLQDGSTTSMEATASQIFDVPVLTTESLNSIMTEVDELQEAALERLISDSLTESYGNVAGYRLTGCDYLNEKLIVDGTTYFTSGNTRKLRYTFTEAYSNEGKIELKGLNEKLGADKQFTLTGKIENKTLITESFKCNK